MKTVQKIVAAVLFFCFLSCSAETPNQKPPLPFDSDSPVRVGIDGLTHDHIHGLLRNINNRPDIQLVGIAESNADLVERLSKQYNFDRSIVYNDVTEMVEKANVEGVFAFNSIYEHLNTVEVCAPRGIHVMVEKPLAVSSKHARRIEQLAKRYGIHVLTNYETSWYPTNFRAFEIALEEGAIGPVNKVLVQDGHRGPVEIGCSKEFLSWLTDPVLNGGGAVIDFGCYGANLMTWLMKNERPLTVTAVLQTIKPEVYPKVDDQATIILTYPNAQAILQGSWNWPVDRKDMEIYGRDGYVKVLNGRNLEFRPNRNSPAETDRITDFPIETSDPYIYFARIIRGKIELKPTDLASLENNLIVVDILEAAKQSAKQGKTIRFGSKK